MLTNFGHFSLAGGGACLNDSDAKTSPPPNSYPTVRYQKWQPPKCARVTHPPPNGAHTPKENPT